jgi:bacterioferritin
MKNKNLNTEKVIEILNKILETELAGVVRYMHYSLMIFGYNRIPIVSWLREQANESMTHAGEAGELITHFGGHPSLSIGSLLETEKHDIRDILLESLDHENSSVDLYMELLNEVEGKSIMLEEYSRRLISEEEQHKGEVNKMLRNPGQIDQFDEKNK